MEGLTVCLPDLRFTRDTARLDEKFFREQIVREDQPGCFSSPGEGPDSLLAEEREGQLVVLRAPDYQPSYHRGLYSTRLISSHPSPGSATLLLLQSPLLPSLANRTGRMGNNQNCLPVRQSREPAVVPPRRRQLVKQRCLTDKTSCPPRQVSADSGIEVDCDEEAEDDVVSDQFSLPARMTSYCESESWVMDQPHWRHFVAHLERTTEPLVRQIQAVTSEDDLLGLVGRVKLLCQDSLICFPKVAGSLGRSPRYQERLRVAVENVVLQLVHPVLWPLVRRLHRRKDRALHRQLSLLWRRRFSLSELGLSEEWQIPLPAALVELAALDMRTTPLDRLSLLQDSLDQVSAHLREAELEREGEGEGSLRYPALLAGLLVSARPLHLASSLFYIQHFTYSAPPALSPALHTLQTSVRLLEGLASKPARRASSRSAGMKRELSLEELISLTDEMEQRYDRHGEVRDADIKLTSLDILREKLARRLELSSQEMTRHQEEAWAQLESRPSTTSSTRRNFLRSLQSRLICSE